MEYTFSTSLSPPPPHECVCVCVMHVYRHVHTCSPVYICSGPENRVYQSLLYSLVIGSLTKPATRLQTLSSLPPQSTEVIHADITMFAGTCSLVLVPVHIEPYPSEPFLPGPYVLLAENSGEGAHLFNPTAWQTPLIIRSRPFTKSPLCQP